MNIHKSYISAVFLGCVFATQAYAYNKLSSGPSFDTCYILLVRISEDILKDYTFLSKNIEIHDGSVRGCKVTIYNEVICMFNQDGFYGPSATLSLHRKTDDEIVTIKVEQNFCLFEAGAITVTPIRGQWEYRSHEGSFIEKNHGTVWLDQVSLNN